MTVASVRNAAAFTYGDHLNTQEDDEAERTLSNSKDEKATLLLLLKTACDRMRDLIIYVGGRTHSVLIKFL